MDDVDRYIIVFFKIPIWWRPRVIRELLVELLRTKFNLEFKQHPFIKNNCFLFNNEMMITVNGNMIDVLLRGEDKAKAVKKDYLSRLFYGELRSKK